MEAIKIASHSCNLEARLEAIKSSWKVPKSVIQDILNFCDECQLGKVNKGFKISQNRVLKSLCMLKIPLEYWQKPLASLTIKDVEQFERDVSQNKLLSYKNKPFSNSTKADIKKVLKVFLKWKLGDKATKLVDWFDVSVPFQTPDYLTEHEVERLYKHCANYQEKFILAVLFDSGARAEEFINIRAQDVFLPSPTANFVKLALKEEYSKTKGRTISLYWKHSLEAVRDYYNQRIKDGIKMSEPICSAKYDTLRQFLHRLGHKVLKKPIHPHLFRHSSATYYATKLNRQELCYRYGWNFSSNMPDVYISRAGMESKELDENFKSTDIEELRKRLEKTEMQLKMMLEKSFPILNKIKRNKVASHL